MATFLGIVIGCELDERDATNPSDGICGDSVAPRLAAESVAPTEVDDACMLQWVRKGARFSLGSYAPPPDDLEDVGDGYVLRRRAAVAFRSLQSAAREAGHSIVAVSGYRSREQQARTFALWVKRHLARSRGELTHAEAAEEVGEFSAHAGHSEHQLGTTVDVSIPGTWPFNRQHELSAFSVSCAGKWVRENAPRFGFTLTYPYGRERVTCSNPEPWHLRYVGATLASELAARGLTLEEWFRRRNPRVSVPHSLRCPPTRPSLDYERHAPKDC